MLCKLCDVSFETKFETKDSRSHGDLDECCDDCLLTIIDNADNYSKDRLLSIARLKKLDSFSVALIPRTHSTIAPHRENIVVPNIESNENLLGIWTKKVR